MDLDPDDTRRLRFFGLGDYASYWQAERAVSVLDEFDGSTPVVGVNDMIELYNATLFVSANLFPASLDDTDRERVRSRVSAVRRAEGMFFDQVTDGSFATIISGVPFDYRHDVLELLGKFKVFDRCDGAVVLAALRADRFHLADLLDCRALVKAYDEQVRALLVDSGQSAELILSKYLLDQERKTINLPASLAAADCRDLLDAYLDSEGANPNFVQLIANARPVPEIGLDPKLKLKARRTYQQLAEKVFENNPGVRSGVAVSLSDTQDVDMVCTEKGLTRRFSYSSAWLTNNLDFPTILNNFIHVFEWATWNQILTFPSYPSELGVLQRVFMTGKNDYVRGIEFRLKDDGTLLQLQMYRRFLQTHDIDIEAVIAWFFTDYLATEFEAHEFKFRPSSPSATYLEKCRHLFSEMESVLKQFSLFVNNGELDLELLSMTSDQLTYTAIPSTATGKYVYIADSTVAQNIQNLLFSDQAHLSYINENLNGHTLVHLLATNEVNYSDFAEHQTNGVDFLIDHGLLRVEDSQVTFGDNRRLIALKDLWDHNATPYWHYSVKGRAAIDDMVAAGWLERRSSLFTAAEVDYINFYLNQKGPSGGPDLRNRYLHGSQADSEDGDDAHLRTYLAALRLMIALTIKINDDLQVRAVETE